MQWYRSAHHRSRQREMDRWCQKHKVGFVRENVCSVLPESKCPVTSPRHVNAGRGQPRARASTRPDPRPAPHVYAAIGVFYLHTTRPAAGPARHRAGGATRALGLVSREIRFDLLNYALGSPCQPATTSPATHRAHDRASPSSPVATCGWPRYTPPRTRYTYMHVAGVTRQNSIAEQSTP
jgi:hypothetical protein